MSDLATKKRSNQRNKGRNPDKNFVGFLVDLKTPKGHFEIN